MVVIAGYLVWLRSRYQPPVSPQFEQTQQVVTPTPESAPQKTATPSATPGEKEATGSMKEKAATSASTKK